MTFPPKIRSCMRCCLFLKAIGHFGESETEKTPERVAEFWHQHLLVGQKPSVLFRLKECQLSRAIP